MTRVSVLIADHQPIVLEGLYSVLSQDPAIVIVGRASERNEIVEKAVDFNPDVLLVDLSLCKNGKPSLLRSVRMRAPKSKIIVFASSEDRGDFVEVIERGSSGILLKENATNLILTAIHKVHRGELLLDPETITAVFRQMALETTCASSVLNRSATRERGELSKREREIIARVAQGQKNKEIAREMSIAEQTVKHHIRCLFRRCGVADRLALALYAVHHHLNERA